MSNVLPVRIVAEERLRRAVRVPAFMESRSARVALFSLVREELRALPRNGFGLGAVVVVLGVLAVVAAFGYGESVRDMLVFTWLVGVLVVGIVVAARVAAARRSRFVDSLFTTPLEGATWFAAQAVVGCVLVVMVLVVQAPFLLLHAAYLGAPALLPNLLVAALFMGAFAVALGLFCGVAVGESGPGAAAGLAGGIGFVAFVLLIVHGLALSGPATPMQATVLRVTSLSPLALVVDGAGIRIFNALPAAAWRPFVGLAGLIFGLAAAAWVAYTRAQGPLGWESRRRGPRVAVVALAAFALVVPVATAEVSFREADDAPYAYYSPGEYTQVAFVPRGSAIHDETFTLSEIYQSPDLPVGEDVELDALVLLLLPAGTSVRGVRIEIEPSDGLLVVSGGKLSAGDTVPSERARPGAGWETLSDGPARPVYRVPVTLRATSVDTLAEAALAVQIHTNFVADGRALASHTTFTFDGEVRGATAQLMLAGLPLPLLALGALVTRKLRTR